jgi:hypothetical protein
MKMANFINLRVLVSMPLFRDGALVTCTVVGAESSGLWLESEELFEDLGLNPGQHRASCIFVPFTQIKFVMEAAVKERAQPDQPEAAISREHEPHQGRGKKRR